MVSNCIFLLPEWQAAARWPSWSQTEVAAGMAALPINDDRYMQKSAKHLKEKQKGAVCVLAKVMDVVPELR